MEVFNLNIIPGAVAPIIHASQYDEDREFRANLFEGDQVFELTGAETISVNVRKPDGNVVTAAVVNTGSNYVEFSTTLQMTACAGANLCQLRIEDSPRKIGTLNFILAVERDPLEGGIPSASEIHNLETQVAEIVADQYDAADVIFDAAPTPGHGVGFAVTSEGVKQADDAVAALIPQNITDLADVNITTPTNGEILVYNNGTWENQANPASTQNFAPDYDDTATYNTNDKVIYQGLLYVCLEDSVTGAWDSTKWQNISVADYNAELLPIQSGSATNTKSYIDSGLSGKADSSTTYTKSEVDTLLSGKAKVEVISLSFTSSNDGLYVVPTSYIPLTKYPVFAYEDTETANYYFTINNYRNTNWLIWCRNAQDLSLATNKSFTVRFVCVS